MALIESTSIVDRTKNTDKQKNILYILDNSVFTHDPMCLYNFEEHNIFISQVVLRKLEIDRNSRSNTAQKAGEALDNIKKHLNGYSTEEIAKGIAIQSPQRSDSEKTTQCTGRLFFQHFGRTSESDEHNNVLAEMSGVIKAFPEYEAVLVAKNVALLVDARAHGKNAEDYTHDKSPFYTGQRMLPDEFWNTHEFKELDRRGMITVSEVQYDRTLKWYSGLYLRSSNNKYNLIVQTVDDSANTAIVETTCDYMSQKNAVFGKRALNVEQSIALNHLMDRRRDFVSLVSKYGTGKTFLAAAAGLEQMERGIYEKIIWLRRCEEGLDPIGFLKGDLLEKMLPWMDALKDNLAVLVPDSETAPRDKPAASIINQDVFRAKLERLKIEVASIEHFDGASKNRAYIVLDEGHTVTPEQFVMIGARAGESSKFVCCANTSKQGAPNLTPNVSGLVKAVAKLRDWEHSAHVELYDGLARSRMCAKFNEIL